MFPGRIFLWTHYPTTPVTSAERETLKRNVLHECRIWSTIRHPNVVQILGLYYPDQSSEISSGLPVMLMEKMHESVTSLVEKYDDIPLLVKLSILHDASLGLRCLHGRNPPILHRDISPNNILLTSYLQAKISDLGVAKAVMTCRKQQDNDKNTRNHSVYATGGIR